MSNAMYFLYMVKGWFDEVWRISRFVLDPGAGVPAGATDWVLELLAVEEAVVVELVDIGDSSSGGGSRVLADPLSRTGSARR